MTFNEYCVERLTNEIAEQMVRNGIPVEEAQYIIADLLDEGERINALGRGIRNVAGAAMQGLSAGAGYLGSKIKQGWQGGVQAAQPNAQGQQQGQQQQGQEGQQQQGQEGQEGQGQEGQQAQGAQNPEQVQQMQAGIKQVTDQLGQLTTRTLPQIVQTLQGLQQQLGQG